jgi:hypothetical protein
MVGGYAKDETVRRTDRTDETETHQEQHGKQKLLRFSRSHIPVNWRAKDARKRIINNQSTINQSISAWQITLLPTVRYRAYQTGIAYQRYDTNNKRSIANITTTINTMTTPYEMNSSPEQAPQRKRLQVRY